MKTMIMIGLLSFLTNSAGAQVTGWVVTTDYSNFGRLRSLGLADPWLVSSDLATIPGDAVARYHEGLLYVVGRGGANLLQIYNPELDMALVTEFSLGTGLNPQDIAFDAAGEAYVSCYDKAILLRVDVATESIVASYSTSSFADADGLPETAWLKIIGDTLYIACQKLNRNNSYAPTGPGALLVFDTVNESFGAPITLTGANPYTQLEIIADGNGGSDLRVGCAGFIGLSDGGIERIDTSAGVSLGFDVSESEFGGDINAFVTTATGVIHAVISDASFKTSIRKYVLASDVLSVLATASDFVHADLAFDGGFQLIVADRTAAASGLRIYDTVSGAELTSAVLPTGLPPFMIVLPPAPPASSVPTRLSAASLSLDAPFPNPCNPRAEIAIAGLPGSPTKVSVFDLRGRRLLTQNVTLNDEGHANWIFTGLDTRGRALPAGVYRIVAENGAGLVARSLTLVK